MKDTKQYLQIIQDLSEEIGISKNDTKSLVDVALSSICLLYTSDAADE